MARYLLTCLMLMAAGLWVSNVESVHLRHKSSMHISETLLLQEPETSTMTPDNNSTDDDGDDYDSGVAPLQSVTKSILRKLVVADAILQHQAMQLQTVKAHTSLSKSLEDMDNVMDELRIEVGKAQGLALNSAKKVAASAQQINALQLKYKAASDADASVCADITSKLSTNEELLRAAQGNTTAAPNEASDSLQSLSVVRERLKRIIQTEQKRADAETRANTLLASISSIFLKLQDTARRSGLQAMNGLSPAAANLLLSQFGASRNQTSNSTNSSGSCAGVAEMVQNQTDTLATVVEQLTVRATSIAPSTTSAGAEPPQQKNPTRSEEGKDVDAASVTTESPNDDATSPASQSPVTTPAVESGTVESGTAVTTSVKSDNSPADAGDNAATTSVSAVDDTAKSSTATSSNDVPSPTTTPTPTQSASKNETSPNTVSAQRTAENAFGSEDVDQQEIDSIVGDPWVPAKLVDAYGHTRGFTMVSSAAANARLRTPSALSQHKSSPSGPSISPQLIASSQHQQEVAAPRDRPRAGGDGIPTGQRDDGGGADVEAAARSRIRTGYKDSWPMLPSHGWYFNKAAK